MNRVLRIYYFDRLNVLPNTKDIVKSDHVH